MKIFFKENVSKELKSRFGFSIVFVIIKPEGKEFGRVKN
jgi:hypothetical protein